MKLVVQRVSEASVKVVESDKVVGKIDKGLFVLVGVGQKDSEKEARILAEKLGKLRIMSDERGKMNLSVCDVGGKILAVSQFTLYADTTGGNRTSFIKAAEKKKKKKIYEYFIDCLKETGIEIETGEFGAYMKIYAQLDGPVTIILEI